MSTVGERIKGLREKRGLSQNQLAKSAKISQAGLSAVESTTKSPNIDTLERLALALGVSLAALVSDGWSDAEPPASTGGVWIPVLGSVQAGIPVSAVEDIVGWEEISADQAARGNFFALKIRGDSMAPALQEGDVVIVRVQESAENGDTVVVMVNGDEATCKKFKRTDNGLFLLPINPAFEALFFSPQEVEELPISVIGKVVESRREW